MTNYTDGYYAWFDRRFLGKRAGKFLPRMKPSNHGAYMIAAMEFADSWQCNITEKIQHITILQQILTLDSIKQYLYKVSFYCANDRSGMMTEVELHYLRCQIKVWVFYKQSHVRLVMHVPKFGELMDVRFPTDFATLEAVLASLDTRIQTVAANLLEDRNERRAARASGVGEPS